jgi:protease II
LPWAETKTPDQFGTVMPGANGNLKQDKARFHFNSFDTWNQLYDLDLKTNQCTLVQDFVYTGEQFESSNYEVKIVYAPTHDGKSIPITLIHSKRAVSSLREGPKSPQKLLMKNYGCYGVK